MILEKVRGRIYDRAKEKFPLEFYDVTEIEPSQSGKPQIIQRAY